MKVKLLFISFTLLGALLILWGWWLFSSQQTNQGFINPLASTSPSPTPISLNHLSFENLKSYQPQASQIKLIDQLADETDYTSYQFSYQSQTKTVTGQLNHPNTATPSAGFPVIIMLRGFVDPAIYETGIGTKNAAAVFAENGYVTLAPDFLGYGGSDDPHKHSIAARLQRPVTVLDLIGSLQSLNYVNPDQLGIWAHSNGGQIALSILEITQRPIPTTLWAPVSKGFPYSILYYMDEYDDQGRALRQILADFEKFHHADDYSIHRYFGDITAPILLHQGESDDAVPLEWSNELSQTLTSHEIDITYHTYPGTDHNLRPAWDTVVQRDVNFFNDQLQSDSL